ncbi:CRISPR-associated helicase Cas3' [Parafrankia sp. BMG5.11]|uniref:CRISPR-associated helicase Cas3' n=1 Tax=Parafrankia sp. BMG5.11 TaxID=222540 RepID=UPI00103D5D7A|nr:CRISPR-associated helicase Cas3' [Parafrankia sp. BMG5.11]TCJ32307.1 CRISPR-associated helicase Cas3' [Parafrankia sp. BMG5.11]
MCDVALGVVWGKSKPKSDPRGSMHLLLGHLLDTAAVGELIWERYLSASSRRILDGCSDGRGRSLFVSLCGLHDVGKVTPAFQMKDDGLAARVRATGLDWRNLSPRQGRAWHHSAAGAFIVRRCLQGSGWNADGCGWVWPLIAGHHGVIPPIGRTVPKKNGEAQGRSQAWVDAQDAFVSQIATDLGVDLASLADVRVPSRAGQLAISGLIIMADWVASDQTRFGGQADLADISLAQSRERALKAWEDLGLRGGWRAGRAAPVGVGDLVRHRFDKPARDAQVGVVRAAEEIAGPGLLIVEAPMGEGKTEAALVAAEVLARRFGADGVFVGMPTQATADPMFTRVRDWSVQVDPEAPLGLLHGRARFNKEWMTLRQQTVFGGIDDADEYGMDDVYGAVGDAGAADRPAAGGVAAAEWFFGRKRGLLAPVAVGTIDHVLHAATRTKHVMLRQAGLAGRVVVLDEVHAYDVYMAQFLFEALRWLADAGVAVIVLSATLPPQLRQNLIRAYTQGALQRRDVAPPLEAREGAAGYPSVTSTCVVDELPVTRVRSYPSWRKPLPVGVEILDEDEAFTPTVVAATVTAEMIDGGCALVVCNTVARAQAVYEALRPAFTDDVVLLHARFTAATRAAWTERVVDPLGPPGRPAAARRPKRLVVVATQVAEQSFDVDVDLLVTDLAPIDLLLQRIGRLHRHDRPAQDRLPRFRQPRVIVAGVRFDPDRPPTWPSGSRAVYGDHLLLRSAALVGDAAAGAGWSVPEQVPALVAAGYGDEPLGPDPWAQTADRYRQEAAEAERRRETNASAFLLSGEDELGKLTLDGLHDRSTAALESEERVAAVVRDGEESVEVILVRRGPSGGYLTLTGRRLGETGEAAVGDEYLLEDVVGATIRLPANKDITIAARRDLTPLPGWDGDPWLKRTRALVLDVALSAQLGGYQLVYDHQVGLKHERTAAR